MIMRAENSIAYLMVLCCVFSLGSCGEWGTRYSGKYDETDNITVNLHRYGTVGIGHGGIGRKILESYSFELQPIKRVYTDDEIKLTQGQIPGATTPVKGTLSFNADYTIDIRMEKDGNLEPFAGNGTYPINEN